MTECIFCKIVKGEIPCKKIWEDKDFLAFEDVSPVAKGHTLVIPKDHFENIFDLPEDLAGKINIVCKKVALLLKEKFSVDSVNIINASGKSAQQSVFHIHYHIIPRKENDGLDLWFYVEK
jgi:histidine triad (HIT) family protein